MNYRLEDTRGQWHDAQETNGRMTVFIVTTATCPIAARYRPLLDRLQAGYPDVVFRGVAPGPLGAPEQAFPVLRDPRFELSRQLRAEVTPEAFLFDAHGRLRYRGRIDDRYVDWGRARPRPTSDDLRGAIDDLRAGRKVKVSRRRGVGCLIEYGAP